MRLLALILALGCSAAWAQTAPREMALQKKDPKAPLVRKDRSASATARTEARQLDKVSKTIKKRRAKPVQNSVPNER